MSSANCRHFVRLNHFETPISMCDLDTLSVHVIRLSAAPVLTWLCSRVKTLNKQFGREIGNQFLSLAGSSSHSDNVLYTYLVFEVRSPPWLRKPIKFSDNLEQSPIADNDHVQSNWRVYGTSKPLVAHRQRKQQESAIIASSVHKVRG